MPFVRNHTTHASMEKRGYKENDDQDDVICSQLIFPSKGNEFDTFVPSWFFFQKVHDV